MTYNAKFLYPHVLCILPKSDICVIPRRRMYHGKRTVPLFPQYLAMRLLLCHAYSLFH
jgi:hypothetical protein